MSKGKKVLIIRNAYDKDCGGAEQYALNLASELLRNNYSPILMTRVPDLIAKAQKSSVPVMRGKWHATQEWGRHYFIRFPLMVMWYMYIILRYRFDIVHPQGRDDFIFASIAAGLLGRRVVWTDHADLKYILDLSIHPFPHLRKWVIWASHFTSSIVCVSNSEKEKIAKNAPAAFREKLVTIHNGVADDTPLHPVDRPDAPLIAANSRLVPDKGIKELLEAVANLPAVHLWIVGGYSNNENMYRTMIERLGISERVTLWGYVTNPSDYVNTADIFVHASYHEAFSLAIVEAAMLGKPIIATSVGGAPEIIDDTSGILVPPKDTAALTNAIQLLLDNPDKAKQLGEQISIKAHENFVFSKIVKEKVIPLYEQ